MNLRVLAAILLTASAGEAATRRGEPEPVELWPCRDALAEARQTLLDGHFDPARDTAAALQLRESASGGIELSIYLQSSADGLHESFALTLDPDARRDRTRWQRRHRAICCDDFAEREDHVVEVVQQRRADGVRATITTVTGRYPERARWTALFISAAKAAADRCLSAGAADRAPGHERVSPTAGSRSSR